MRLLFAVACLAPACTAPAEDDQYFPDAQIACANSAPILAPLAGEHYSPHLVVIAEVRTIDLVQVVTAAVTDERGAPYAPVGAATTTIIDSLYPAAQWSFELPPSGRYELTVSGPAEWANEWCPQTVTFFTSAE
jgi:hypothetical protein